MRIPRSLQVFIPFGILDNALDPTRSRKERGLYGGMFGIFVLAIIAAVLNNFDIGQVMSDFIRYAVLSVYTCVMIYVMFVGGRSVFRMGKSAQGLSKLGYHTLGVLCIFCGILLILLVPYVLYFNFS